MIRWRHWVSQSSQTWKQQSPELNPVHVILGQCLHATGERMTSARKSLCLGQTDLGFNPVLLQTLYSDNKKIKYVRRLIYQLEEGQRENQSRLLPHGMLGCRWVALASQAPALSTRQLLDHTSSGLLFPWQLTKARATSHGCGQDSTGEHIILTKSQSYSRHLFCISPTVAFLSPHYTAESLLQGFFLSVSPE